MKIVKNVEHHIRMGEYESLKVGATVELDVPEGVSKATALDEADELLRDALAPDLKQARELCDPNSYVTEWRN